MRFLQIKMSPLCVKRSASELSNSEVSFKDMNSNVTRKTRSVLENLLWNLKCSVKESKASMEEKWGKKMPNKLVKLLVWTQWTKCFFPKKITIFLFCVRNWDLPLRHFKCYKICCCYGVYPGPIFPLRTLLQANSHHLQQLHLGTC